MGRLALVKKPRFARRNFRAVTVLVQKRLAVAIVADDAVISMFHRI